MNSASPLRRCSLLRSPARQRYCLLLLLASLLCFSRASAGHLHRHVQYNRVRHRALVDDASPLATAPLSSDVAQLQQDLTKFPSHLISFLSNIQSRLGHVESLMAAATAPAPSDDAKTLAAPLTPTMLAPSSPPMPLRTSLQYVPTSQPTAPTSGRPNSPLAPSPSHTFKAPFDPLATDNIAVYYGQSPATSPLGLLSLCADPAINIVNLAFVPTLFTPSGYPATSFGPACSGQTPTQAAAGTGLQDCALLGQHITACQTEHNTAILVSVGGYLASTALPSRPAAVALAATLWDLFAGDPAAAPHPHLRPFGNASVDGFDLDNEDHDPRYYADLAAALRDNFNRDTRSSPPRTYYLGAAPQCLRPDASIPSVLLRHADFVWVQFYNNPACDVAGPGFAASLAAWSADLAEPAANATTETTARVGRSGRGPRLFVGMGAWPGAGSGYVPGVELRGVMDSAGVRALSNVGGAMLWDGSEALLNADATTGVDYVGYTKAALR